MVKFLKTGKRVITFALSATLILGEASVSLAAPRVNFDPAIDVIEESDITGDYTPGKVTNVGFKSYSARGVINKYILSWDAVQGADLYQIRVVDPAGKEYGYPGGYDSKTNKYLEISYQTANYRTFDLSQIKSLPQLELKDGSYQRVIDKDGNNIHPAPNTTFKIQVRAVNKYDSKNTYGAWSDVVSYTTDKVQKPEKPSDVRIYQNNSGMSGAAIAEANVEYFRRSIIDGIVKHKSPVSLLYGNHFVTIIGIQGTKIKYLDSGSMRKDGVRFGDLKDMCGSGLGQKMQLVWFEQLDEGGKNVVQNVTERTDAVYDGDKLRIEKNKLEGDDRYIDKGMERCYNKKAVAFNDKKSRMEKQIIIL